MMGAKSGKLSSFSESVLIFSGFSNWKDATRCFNKHEGSATYKATVRENQGEFAPESPEFRTLCPT